MTAKKKKTTRKKNSSRRKSKKATLFQRFLNFVDSNRFFVIICVTLVLLITILTCAIIHVQKEKKDREYIETYIDAACDEFDVPKSLVYAVIKTESSFDPYAESTSNARGLMQINKITLKEINMRMGTDYAFGQMFDPEINIRCGVFYLSYLINRFEGYYNTVFAAYNAGPTIVSSWLQDSEYSKDQKQLINFPVGYDETKDYIEKINRYWDDYKELYD